MDCNHWIGIINNFHQIPENDLYVNTLKEMLLDNALYYKREPIEFVDKRKSLSTLFNHCPLCGIKINWIRIRKMINE